MKRLAFLILLLLSSVFLLQAEGGLIKKVQSFSLEHLEVRRIFSFGLVLLFQLLLLGVTSFVYKRVKRKITALRDTKDGKPEKDSSRKIDPDKQVSILISFANLVRWFLVSVQLLISVPILFSIFPETKDLASLLFSYIWKPIKIIWRGIVDYIPNLCTIIVIVLVIRYVVRFIWYITEQVEDGRLKIAGFYADWAQPTYHIVRFLLYAFMLAMIYPYLPGADSGEFKGISVFVGLIVSLGSSTVIGNIIAGFVITYMRPFKLGDRIKLNDTVGFVVEKSALVTRIRTPKNELVTIPNSFMMSSQTTNYSESARNLGLIVHTEVTISYEIPWRKVHQLLIDAAKATPGVSSEPEPFVQETALRDFFPIYQINAYVKEAGSLNQLYANLYQNIQDKFIAAGVEILSPHYTSFRNGNASTVPREAENVSNENK